MNDQRPFVRPGQLSPLRRPAPLPFRRPGPDRRVTILPRPRTLRSMTVCIAAVSIELKRIFTVTDRKLSDGTYALDDAASKIRALTQDQLWWCMFSCDDTTILESLLRRISADIPSDGLPLSVEVITDAVGRSYRAELRAMAERRGLKRRKEIDALVTGVELLISGFDAAGDPHLVYVNPCGQPASWDQYGVCAIGQGSQAAWASLRSNLDFLRSRDGGLIIYRLCEAKFLAEAFESVGDSTTVVTIDNEGTTTILYNDAIIAARKAWIQARAQRLPHDLLRSLTGGGTYDSANRYVPHEMEQRHTNARFKFEAVMPRLEGLRAAKRIDDDKWRRVRSLRSRVETLSPQVVSALEEWETSTVRPSSLDYLLERYCEAVEGLCDVVPGL